MHDLYVLILTLKIIRSTRRFHPRKRRTLITTRGGHSVLRFGSVPWFSKKFGSKKFQEPSISVLGYFGSVSVLTELTEFFYRKLR